MPVDTLFSLIGKAKDMIIFIIDRLEQMKLSENAVSRIKESLEYLQSTVIKIEPYLKKDSDMKEIQHFYSHLEKAFVTCSYISEKNKVMKFAKAPGTLLQLHTLEAEIKLANSKLLLFITANNLTIQCESTDYQNKILEETVTLQQNRMAGLSIIKNKSMRRPPAPTAFKIQEFNNKIKLSWEPSEGTVDEYEICYDEHRNRSFRVDGECTDVEIDSTTIRPGEPYVMKVCGINEGGKGEWSNALMGHLTKPFPQRPEISELFFRSTTAVVTVKIPDIICSTESPVTRVEIAYNIPPSNQLYPREFEIEPAAGNNSYVFTIKELCPNSKYNFTAKTKNAEGWSKYSKFQNGNTSPLPPKPTKPDCPYVIACSSNEVNLKVEVPENTCSQKSPVIAWELRGFTDDKEEVIKYYTLDENDYTKQSIDLPVTNLNPNQKYTFQVFAQNENGWSEPSDKFEIHIAIPSTPKNIRASTNRTHSQIKIRWNAPESILITHYEIMRRTKKGNYSDVKPVKAPANKFSATFTKLKQSTHYCFKIRTCNGLHASAWSEEIESNTRIHKGIKAVLSPVVWALGTVTSPLLTPIGGAGVAALAAHDKAGPKSTVAAGAAGAVGGAALGIVGAPLVGAGYAHMFVHGIDQLSDQSDDENAVIIEC